MKARKRSTPEEDAAIRHEIIMACASLGFMPFKEHPYDKKKEEGKKLKP